MHTCIPEKVQYHYFLMLFVHRLLFSFPAYPPPTYNEVNNHKNHWSGDHYSGSDNERNPSHKKVIVDMKGSVEKLPPPPVEGYEIGETWFNEKKIL